MRPVNKEDLKYFKYKEDEECANCGHVGSYRTTDYYLCEQCMYVIIRLEENEDET